MIGLVGQIWGVHGHIWGIECIWARCMLSLGVLWWEGPAPQGILETPKYFWGAWETGSSKIRCYRGAYGQGMSTGAPSNQDSMGKYWIGLLYRADNQGMRRGDAEPLGRARMGLGHLRTPKFVWHCMIEWMIFYMSCMLSICYLSDGPP